jgi:aspartyl-tRNA(Asn)/glutamyl-tRNA(Gln) amidotransferase subunit A
MIPLWQLSAVALVNGFVAGSFTPSEALQSVLARLDAVNPSLNAVIALADVSREAAASDARYAAGKPLSGLDGVPISIKDNLVMASVVSTWGTRALKGWLPARDELPVARLRAAGALLFAKTNVPEFTLEGYTANPVYGVTGNPWALELTPGGSSGGAAAAVAAGIGPLALGTDGGGSIRRPAAHCGLVGVKPSIGTIARADGFPSLLLDFEVVGPLARTLEDAELMLGVLSGATPEDRLSQGRTAVTAGRTGDRTRQLLCVTELGDAPVDAEIRRQVTAAASMFGDTNAKEADVRIEYGFLPLDLSAINEIWREVGQIGLARLAERHPDWLAQASPAYFEMAEAGARLPATRMWEINERVMAFRRQVDAMFGELDALIMPSIAALSWSADQAFPTMIDGHSVGPRGHAAFTGWVNAAGNPAINLPTAPAVNGLPIGFQLVGPWGGEADLLALAQRYVERQPWQSRYDTLWGNHG